MFKLTPIWFHKNPLFQENYFFALRENEGAFYNELQTRYSLHFVTLGLLFVAFISNKADQIYFTF